MNKNEAIALTAKNEKLRKGTIKNLGLTERQFYLIELNVLNSIATHNIGIIKVNGGIITEDKHEWHPWFGFPYKDGNGNRHWTIEVEIQHSQTNIMLATKNAKKVGTDIQNVFEQIGYKVHKISTSDLNLTGEPTWTIKLITDEYPK